jgi:hypothetical protein
MAERWGSVDESIDTDLDDVHAHYGDDGANGHLPHQSRWSWSSLRHSVETNSAVVETNVKRREAQSLDEASGFK